MDLLTNAVESIQAGIEDYNLGTRPRLLSAVRNIHAGILLLFKEALRRRSPPGSKDALVKARNRPEVNSRGDTVIVGFGAKTADVQQIKERFEGLKVVVDWKRFDSISSLRNDIEHFYPALSQEAVKSIISSAFVIIRTFCVDELNEDPRKLFGDETWDAMLRVAEVYQAEKAHCAHELATVDWSSDTLEEGIETLRCTACGSDLLVPKAKDQSYADVVLVCRACGDEMATEDVIREAVAGALGWEAYLAATDGDEEPYGNCPECGNETYVAEEGRCAACGEEGTSTCSRCGSRIPISELHLAPLCSYCEHVTTKDD